MSNAQKGFASMDPVKRAAICSLGGKAAHAKGTAHKWSREDARKAGKKGGLAKRRTAPPTAEEPAA